tara:strand:+ start:282 stop:497 length:216 start_codon:yes stop_codon:yes gene_type:complete
MNTENKITNEALNEFLGDDLTIKNIAKEDCVDQECKLKSKDGLIESTRVINKRVIVEDGRELLREVTFKHE